MLKFNRNKVFGLFSTAALSTFLFASSCGAVEPVLLGYITIKAISPEINYGQLNDPLIVNENAFYEIPTTSHGILYMRFVSNDGEIIGPWTEVTDKDSLKAPENEGLYQIQFLIKSDDPGNILNYPNGDFGTFDGSKFSNVFNGLVGDESIDPSGKVVPIVYESNVEVMHPVYAGLDEDEYMEPSEYTIPIVNESNSDDNKNESEESAKPAESEKSQEFVESGESEKFDEFSESDKFYESNKSDESGNPTLENNKDEESKQSESSEDFSEESKNGNINLGENKSDESKQESYTSEKGKSDISRNNSLKQTDSSDGNSIQDSSASPISSTYDYSTSSQSSNGSSLKSSSSSSSSEQSSSKSKSSSIKTNEEPSYIFAIMIGSLAISLLCIMEQRKKSKSDESK